jgi:DNA polymerase-3 subunit gamma/tau
LKSVSLKSLAKKVQQPQVAKSNSKEEKKPEEPIDPTWQEAFNQEKLDEAWRRFTRQYENRPRLHTIYKNHAPQLVGKASLLIKLLNTTQEHELNKERSNILSYLRRNLKNAGIVLTMEISQEEDKNSQKAFTVADKYKLMAEKNPALALLRKEFNLDLE